MLYVDKVLLVIERKELDYQTMNEGHEGISYDFDKHEKQLLEN